MNYIGIDVGADKYFVVWYSGYRRRINKQFFNNHKDLYNLLEDKRGVIAIDAPSGCSNNRNAKRRCEAELGIGGYFLTPSIKDLAKPWMQSGFKLWEFLLSKGYKRARSIPTKQGSLIEVHPTLIFKKMLNPQVNPKLWINRKNPVSKAKLQGRNQRKRILKQRFPVEKAVIGKLRIDYLDALIAAYTAEQSHRGKVRVFGNPNEGQIWFPKR